MGNKEKLINIPASWHRHKCIFIPIPKTGTTSISRLIAKPNNHPHPDILEIKKNMIPQRFESYFKFSFVRNPWSRAVSIFKSRPYTERAWWGHKCGNFEEFVDSYDMASKYCRFPSEKKNQLDWLCDESGNLLVDYVGRFEDFENDAMTVFEKLGFKKENLIVPHENKLHGNRNHYASLYTEKTIEKIYENFKKDIEYFGYKFGD